MLVTQHCCTRQPASAGPHAAEQSSSHKVKPQRLDGSCALPQQIASATLSTKRRMGSAWVASLTGAVQVKYRWLKLFHSQSHTTEHAPRHNKAVVEPQMMT